MFWSPRSRSLGRVPCWVISNWVFHFLLTFQSYRKTISLQSPLIPHLLVILCKVFLQFFLQFELCWLSLVQPTRTPGWWALSQAQMPICCSPFPATELREQFHLCFRTKIQWRQFLPERNKYGCSLTPKKKAIYNWAQEYLHFHFLYNSLSLQALMCWWILPSLMWIQEAVPVPAVDPDQCSAAFMWNAVLYCLPSEWVVSSSPHSSGLL